MTNEVNKTLIQTNLTDIEKLLVKMFYDTSIDVLQNTLPKNILMESFEAYANKRGVREWLREDILNKMVDHAPIATPYSLINTTCLEVPDIIELVEWIVKRQRLIPEIREIKQIHIDIPDIIASTPSLNPEITHRTYTSSVSKIYLNNLVCINLGCCSFTFRHNLYNKSYGDKKLFSIVPDEPNLWCPVNFTPYKVRKEYQLSIKTNINLHRDNDSAFQSIILKRQLNITPFKLTDILDYLNVKPLVGGRC